MGEPCVEGVAGKSKNQDSAAARMRWVLALAALPLVAAGCLSALKLPPDLPLEDVDGCDSMHWHVTLGLYVADAAGQPQRVDFTAPKTQSGHTYYDFDSTRLHGGAPDFDLSVHMHQNQASPESGLASVAAAQIHLEDAGRCATLESALRKLDVEAAADGWTLTGAHDQVRGQAGTHTGTVRWWLQAQDGCDWTWNEKAWAEVAGHQLQDNEAVLGSVGDYTAEQVAAMQASVPAPSSRLPMERCGKAQP